VVIVEDGGYTSNKKYVQSKQSKLFVADNQKNYYCIGPSLWTCPFMVSPSNLSLLSLLQRWIDDVLRCRNSTILFKSNVLNADIRMIEELRWMVLKESLELLIWLL